MPINLPSADTLAEIFAEIAIEAGTILKKMRPTVSNVVFKPDGSPTTEADHLAEELILHRLSSCWPDIPVIAEESGGERDANELFFLVDPLDGTRDYIRPEGEYSVNIALIRGQRPIAAAIAAPEFGRVWIAGDTARTSPIGIDKNDFCMWQPLSTRSLPEDGGVALTSRRRDDSGTKEILKILPVKENRRASSAVKFCLIAQGDADIYVRCRPTMEWDTAAGDHILTKAGGVMFGLEGRPFLYGRAHKNYENGSFAALGDRCLASLINLPETNLVKSI